MTGSTTLAVPPLLVLAEVADLATYPHWLGIVHEVVATDDGAWLVDLGARVGPLRRTKRVRMVRTLYDPVSGAVRFERAELDGRAHSAWVLSAAVVPTGEGSSVTMHLHYGGSAWLPGTDLVVRQEMRRAGSRLAARLQRFSS